MRSKKAEHYRTEAAAAAAADTMMVALGLRAIRDRKAIGSSYNKTVMS